MSQQMDVLTRLLQQVAGQEADSPHLDIQINDYGMHLIARDGQPRSAVDEDGNEVTTYDDTNVVAALTYLGTDMNEAVSQLAAIIQARLDAADGTTGIVGFMQS